MAIIFDAEPSTIQITADAEVVPKGYKQLVDRVEALEGGTIDESVIAQAVTDYLDEHGVTVTTDDTLDTTSTNPIQNAPVATAIEEINTELDSKADATVTRTDTTSAETAISGDTVDVVDSVTTNSAGQVTAVNTKTVTLPESTSVSVTQTLTEGTEIGSIDVDGTATKLYAPSASGSSGTWELAVHETATEDVVYIRTSSTLTGRAMTEYSKVIVVLVSQATSGTSTGAWLSFNAAKGWGNGLCMLTSGTTASNTMVSICEVEKTAIGLIPKLNMGSVNSSSAINLLKLKTDYPVFNVPTLSNNAVTSPVDLENSYLNPYQLDFGCVHVTSYTTALGAGSELYMWGYVE